MGIREDTGRKSELCPLIVQFYVVIAWHWQDYLKNLSFKEMPTLHEHLKASGRVSCS